jgi:lipopolysaccharide transport system permease protein
MQTSSLLTQPFALLYRQRRLIATSTAAEIRRKYAGFLLGGWWLVLSPLLMLAVYVVLYLYILRFQPAQLTQGQYVLFMFCGLVPYFAIADGLTAGMGALLANRAILKSTVFPGEILPVRSVLASAVSFAIGLALLLAGAGAVGRVTPWLLVLPVLAALQVLFVIGLAWVLSLVVMVLRDVQNVIGFILMALLIISPIAFTPEMLPAALRWLLWANPLSYFMLAYQGIVVHGAAPDTGVLVTIAVVSLATFVAGHAFFVTARRVILEYA